MQNGEKKDVNELKNDISKKDERDLTEDERKFKELDSKIAQKIKNDEEITTLDKNITAMMPYAIDTSLALFGLEENKKFGVYMGKDPLDLNIINLETKEYLYNSPAKDVEKKIIEFEEEYARHRAIFIYGIGNGVFLKSILANPTHKKIFVFEPEIEILYAALSLIDFARDIFTDRLVILDSHKVTFLQFYIICKMPDVFHSFRLYNLHIIDDYYNNEKYQENIMELNKTMQKAIIQTLYERGNDSKDCLLGMIQTTQHLPDVFGSIPLRDIINKRKNKINSAVVVSTGPSLHKQLPILKKLAPYTVIVAVDASYPILKEYGIKPDYVTSIERIQPTPDFFKPARTEFDDGIIFVVASLTHHEAVENLHDKDVCYAMRPLNYEMSFRDFKFGYIGGGQSAAHMAWNVAQALGCKDVMLIGQDLAYGEDGTSHSKGHIFKETEIPVEEVPIMTTKYGGKGEIQTTFVWNLFRQYFEHNIAMLQRSNPDYKLYNCTEGGARIEGTTEIPFKEMAEKIIAEGKKKNFKPILPISKEKQEEHLKKAIKNITKIFKTGHKIQKKCERLYLKIAKEIEKSKKLKEQDKADKINYDKLQKLSFEIDSLKEYVFKDKVFMSSFYGICGAMLNSQELELAVISARRADTDEEKNDKLFEWVSCQSYWIFSLAGSIDATLGKLADAASGFMDSHKLLEQ